MAFTGVTENDMPMHECLSPSAYSHVSTLQSTVPHSEHIE